MESGWIQWFSSLLSCYYLIKHYEPFRFLLSLRLLSINQFSNFVNQMNENFIIITYIRALTIHICRSFFADHFFTGSIPSRPPVKRQAYTRLSINLPTAKETGNNVPAMTANTIVPRTNARGVKHSFLISLRNRYSVTGILKSIPDITPGAY